MPQRSEWLTAICDQSIQKTSATLCKMRFEGIAIILALCSFALEAQVSSADSSAAGKTNAHHFKSGLGLSYEVPPYLKVLSNKPFDVAVRDLAFKQSPTAQEVKSINCAQPLLIAENRDESRIINLVATPQGCATGIVTQKNIAEFGKYGAGELGKHFALVDPEFRTFTVGSHSFWVMRSAMLPNPPNNPNGEIAILVTFTPQAVIQCMVLARTPADLHAIAATHLKFEDGSETELIPPSAFGDK